MPVHAGERARETGTFHCRDCDATARVKKGTRIPECPCGASVYNQRTKEPGTRTRTRQRKTAKKRPRAAAGPAAGSPRTSARATICKRTTTRAMARQVRAGAKRGRAA